LKTGVVIAGRYRLDEPIAAGGVGQVWRGTDLVLERRVAVKLVRPEYSDHPDTLARFRAEARHAGALTHPCIAQVYDFGDSAPGAPPYMVMELVEGPSLADVLVQEPVTAPYALEVIAKAAAGLGAAHEAGLVHRDVKPGNILLGPDGDVKITDFGIAHALGSAPVTDPGLVMGTTQYLAPERIAGGSGTPGSDLYSLGIMLHECLTGVPPFEGTPAEVMAAHLYMPLPALPPGTRPEVEDLIARLAAKDPAARLCDANEAAALALRVRAVITANDISPRQRQALAISPASGVPAPSGVAPGSRDSGSAAPRGIVTGPHERNPFAQRQLPALPPVPVSDVSVTMVDFADADAVNAGIVDAGVTGAELTSVDLVVSGLPPVALPMVTRPPVAALPPASAAGTTVRIASPDSVSRPGAGRPGDTLAVRVLPDTGPLDRDSSGREPRRGSGLRHAGKLVSGKGPGGRRRAAIGVGLVVIAGAGATGWVVSGAAQSSLSNRANNSSLSVVQPSAGASIPAALSPAGNGGASTKTYAPKHAKATTPAAQTSSAPAPQTTAPATPAAPATSAGGTTSGSGSSSGSGSGTTPTSAKPQPSTTGSGKSTPPGGGGLLGLLGL
jgi:serine/threonine-protein kinase